MSAQPAGGGNGSTGGGGDAGGGNAGGGGGAEAPAPQPPPAAASIDFAAAIAAGYSYAYSKGWDPSGPVGGSFNTPCVGSSTEDLISKIYYQIDFWTLAIGGDPTGCGISIYQYGDGVAVQV